jgi:hypothetical protein
LNVSNACTSDSRDPITEMQRSRKSDGVSLPERNAVTAREKLMMFGLYADMKIR